MLQCVAAMQKSRCRSLGSPVCSTTTLRWSRIAPFHQLFHARPAIWRRQAAVTLHSCGFAGEVFIFDRTAKPTRVTAVAQMIQPCLIVYTGSELQEADKILGSEIERAFRAAEIEAAIRPELSLWVFAAVPLWFFFRHPS